MARATGFGYGLLAAILLVGLNLRGSIAAVSPVLPDIRADLHMSAGTAGLLTSLPVLCFALGAPGAVWLGRRLGIYRALLVGCLVIALATLLRPYAGTWLLLATTVVLGLAMTVGNVLMPVAVKRDFGSAAGRITGVSTASLSTGAALAAGLTAPLSVWLGWRHALAVWAVLAVVAMVALSGPARASHAPSAATAPAPRAGSTGLRTDPVAWAVTARQYPPSGASQRSAGRRVLTAMPTPMPMNAVNNGCAKGLSTQRITKVSVTSASPPGPEPRVPLYDAPR